MTKIISTLTLVVALFCGTVLADDGNMGGTGYTECGGINPAPTCPPPGLANMGSTDGSDASNGSDIGDITLVVTGVVETIGLIY